MTDQQMNKDAAQILIEIMLEAVHEQQVMPLLMALGTLTAEGCRDPAAAQRLAAAFRSQADSCPPDMAGRTYLEALAALAAAPTPPSSDDVQTALRSRLRLIQGRKSD